jgi:hypothetical protein
VPATATLPRWRVSDHDKLVHIVRLPTGIPPRSYGSVAHRSWATLRCPAPKAQVWARRCRRVCAIFDHKSAAAFRRAATICVGCCTRATTAAAASATHRMSYWGSAARGASGTVRRLFPLNARPLRDSPRPGAFRDVPDIGHPRPGGSASGATQKVKFSITIRTATVMAAASSAAIAAAIIISRQVICS